MALPLTVHLLCATRCVSVVGGTFGRFGCELSTTSTEEVATVLSKKRPPFWFTALRKEVVMATEVGMRYSVREPVRTLPSGPNPMSASFGNDQPSVGQLQLVPNSATFATDGSVLPKGQAGYAVVNSDRVPAATASCHPGTSIFEAEVAGIVNAQSRAKSAVIICDCKSANQAVEGFANLPRRKQLRSTARYRHRLY
jgi:hypothetical protein